MTSLMMGCSFNPLFDSCILAFGSSETNITLGSSSIFTVSHFEIPVQAKIFHQRILSNRRKKMLGSGIELNLGTNGTYDILSVVFFYIRLDSAEISIRGKT